MEKTTQIRYMRGNIDWVITLNALKKKKTKKHKKIHIKRKREGVKCRNKEKMKNKTDKTKDNKMKKPVISIASMPRRLLRTTYNLRDGQVSPERNRYKYNFNAVDRNKGIAKVSGLNLNDYEKPEIYPRTQSCEFPKTSLVD